MNNINKRQYENKITRKDGEKHGIKMLVFDGMSVEDFEAQQNNIAYMNRRGKLEEFWNTQRIAVTKWFTLNYFLSYIAGRDTSEINKWLNYNIEAWRRRCYD